MKKFFTLIIASIFATSMFAQIQAPNPSFENWSAADIGELPDGWDGLNRDVGYGINVETVTKDDTDPQDGTYSAKLTTVNNSILGDLPGVLTLGVIDLVNQTITGGMAYTDKPAQLTGYYKFNPAATDTATIGIAFYNGVDTIGQGSIEIIDAASTWTAFTVDITYTGTLFPDTMNILCVTSIQSSPVVGTVLDVDNLQLVGGTIDVPQNLMGEKAFSISPNPANTFVNINIPNVNNDVKIILHNTVGQVVYSNTFNNVNDVNERIDISEFNSGIYFVEIINGNKSSIEKLIIK